MFKKLSVGQKIMLGSLVILIFLSAVALTAFMAISKADLGFAGYHEIARDTNLSGRLQANMLMVRMNVKDFLITASDKDLQEYQEYLQKMTVFLEAAKKHITHPSRAPKIQEVAQAVGSYQSAFSQVVEITREYTDLETNTLNRIGPRMERQLTLIMESAARDRDPEAAFRSGKALRSLLLGRLYVFKFLATHSEPDQQRVESEFGLFETLIKELDAELENPRRRQLLAEIRQVDHVYAESFKKVAELVRKRDLLIAETLDRIGPMIAKTSRR